MKRHANVDVGTILYMIFLYEAIPAWGQVNYVHGDVEIGGLFEIWEKDGDKCSSRLSRNSVQHYEAAKWAVQYVNGLDYLPGISLGLKPVFTCNVDGKAAEETLNILTNAKSDNFNISQNNFPLVGLLGPEYSSEAIRTSRIINTLPTKDQLLQIPFSSTSDLLSNLDVFRNIKRTVPVDRIQREVMTSLLKKLEWNYVAVIYEDNDYGKESFAEFRSYASKNDICIPFHSKLSFGSLGELDPSEINVILRDITQHVESPISGVVFFGSSKSIRFILSSTDTLRGQYSFRLLFVLSSSVHMEENYFKVDGNVIKAARGVYLVSPPKINYSGFTEHWKTTLMDPAKVVNESSTNSWLRQLYYDIHTCNSNTDIMNCMPSVSGEKQAQYESIYTPYAIEAILIFAKLLKKMHTAYCKNEAGLCTGLKNVLTENRGELVKNSDDFVLNTDRDFPSLQVNISITFQNTTDAIKHGTISDYEVFQYRKCTNDASEFCFLKVGSYLNMSLALDTGLLRDYSENLNMNFNGAQWPNLLKAQCADTHRCSSCVNQQIQDQDYFQDGDLFVIGLVPVFDKSSNNPIECGGMRAALGVQLAEAMVYAVKLVNEKKDKYTDYFPGKRIGVILINTCNQPLRGVERLLEIIKNGLTLSNGAKLDIYDKLLGIVGGYGSSVSVAIADVLSPFNLLQISYASTAPVLSDRSTYPYFLRVTTPDDKQAKAMAQVVKDLDSEYVQIIYSEGTYGEGGRDSIRLQTQLLKICIAREVKVIEGRYNTLLDDLRSSAYAKIVIVFLRSHVVSAAMDVLYSAMDQGEFVFIGSEAWSDRAEIIADKPYLAGSFSFGLKMAERTDFDEYLRNLEILSQQKNPWLRSYYELKYNCYLPGSFDKMNKQPCTNIGMASASRFDQDLWTPFAQNAMFSLLGGCSRAFVKLCGPQFQGICTDYRAKVGEVVDEIKTEKLVIDESGSAKRVFSDNGDGNVGYRIYQVQKMVNNPLKTEYVQVGRSTLDENGFTFEKHRLSFPYDGIPSTCPNTRACAHCFKSETMSTIKPQDQCKQDSTPVMAGMGALIGILSIALIALIVIMIWNHRRLKGNTSADDYLDAVPSDLREYRNPYLSSPKYPSEPESVDSGIDREVPIGI